MKYFLPKPNPTILWEQKADAARYDNDMQLPDFGPKKSDAENLMLEGSAGSTCVKRVAPGWIRLGRYLNASFS